jgi:hypothetical protein
MHPNPSSDTSSVPSFRFFMCLLFLAGRGSLAAVNPSPLDVGYRQMYNLDFAGAHITFESWEHAHREDLLAGLVQEFPQNTLYKKELSDPAAESFNESCRLQIAGPVVCVRSL